VSLALEPGGSCTPPLLACARPSHLSLEARDWGLVSVTTPATLGVWGHALEPGGSCMSLAPEPRALEPGGSCNRGLAAV